MTVCLCLARSSYVGSKPLFVTRWIKIATASVVLCIFCLLRCGLAPAIKTAFRDMLDQKRLFVTVGSKLLPPVLFSACFVCCDAGLLLPSKPLLVTCWIKTALRDMLDQNFSRQCCSLHFLSAAASFDGTARTRNRNSLLCLFV